MSVGAAPAGSVEDVQLLAGRLHDVGIESWEAGRRLAGVRAGGWVGEAARAFDAAAADVPPQLDRAGEAFAGASLALRAYAFELAQAQDAARRAAVLWADAEAASAAWRRSLEVLADDDPRRSSADPGVGGRVAAQRLYDDALAELEVVAQRTAARLREAADVAPDAPGLWTQVWNAGKSFAGGVWGGATGIADFALRFNPVRLALDPDGFARDAKQLADGLWYAVTNPGEVVDAFIQAFKDDPARAFGEMLPGLLMGPAALSAAGKVANQLADIAKQLPGRMRQMPTLLKDDRGSASLELLTLGLVRQTDIPHLDVETVVRDIEAMTGLSFERLGGGLYRSPVGLLYGPSGTNGLHPHRILHVLAHTLPDPSKEKHSVFRNGVEAFAITDQAWVTRLRPERLGERVHRAWFDEPVGTDGEGLVKVVTRPNSMSVVTSHPMHP